MKKPLHILRPAVLIVIGLMLALVSAAVGQPAAFGKAGTPTVIVTSTPPAVSSSEIGSTDGLVFVSAIIVVIILTPMLLRWKTWLRKP